MDLLSRRGVWRPLGAAALAIAGCPLSSGGLVGRAGPFSTSQASAGREAAEQVDAKALQGHVKNLERLHLAGTDFTLRVKQPPGPDPVKEMPHSSKRSGQYVVDTLAALGYSPVSEEESGEGFDTRNVYADIPGRKVPEDLVLLTAHHDAWYAGANDNSSGVAILLEAARVLKDSGPDRTIRIVAFDAEEMPYLGSRRFLQKHPELETRLSLLVNMDCMGVASSEPNSQDAPPGLRLPTTADFLLAMANEPAGDAVARFTRLAAGLPAPLSVVGGILPNGGHTPALGQALFSDHRWFWRKKLPAIFLTDTCFQRSPHYHQPTDRFETLNLDFFARSARATIAGVAAFASAE